MYLYEAIRLGAMSCEQGTGNRSMEAQKRCALGAALLALGDPHKNHDDLGYTILMEKFPITESLTKYPPTGEIFTILKSLWMLNDSDNWTREQIADWLEPIEIAYYEEHPEHKPKDVEVPESVMEPELVEARF